MNNSVGLNVDKISLNEEIMIEILYKDRKGNKVFPNNYTMKVKDIVSYPYQVLKYGIKVYIVPINDLNIVDSD